MGSKRFTGFTRFSRRDFLRTMGLGAVVLLSGGLDRWGRSFAPKSALAQAAAFVPDAEIALTAKEKWVQILPGTQTRVWGYEGQLLSGTGASVEAIPGSYLGPIIRAQSGMKLRILFHNRLAEKSVLHPHGLRVPVASDGGPMQAIDPGQTKIYEFEVIDRASPAWFHPHPMGRTAEQVVMGLAGLLYVSDPDEQKTVPGAASGENDLPVVIQDRQFDANNQFLYRPNMMWGYLGDRILVNGQPQAKFSLEPRGYRLRLLNGSNARTYKLAWSNAMPLQVIGTDGGLLPEPVLKDYLMLMPGERADIWVDFSPLAGQQVILRSLAFQPGMMGGMMGGMGGGMGMMGGMGGGMGMMGMGSALANGAEFDILNVNVGRQASSAPALGAFAPLAVRYERGNVPNFDTPRPFTLSMGHMMTWMINGRVYQPDAVAADEKVGLNETMAWEWINASPIPHCMHLHNAQFQVVARDATGAAAGYSSVNQGLVDSGWKDTVLVWPGERVKIAVKFAPYSGMYMYHCHLLEHEDMTMMRNFLIGARNSGM
jgi:FtsP/CotA-like multicopper oxidase with cupredoxin domain